MPVPPLHPASAWSETIHPEAQVPKAILADKIDPSSGEYLSLVEGRGIADGAVIQMLRTERGTGASVMTRGSRFREIQYVDVENDPALVKSYADEALRPLIDNGVLRIEEASLAASADPAQEDVEVKYRDLLKSASDLTTMAVPRKLE